jgi:tRNA (mo5U34)-methyltransferase
MIDFDGLGSRLGDLGLSDWCAPLETLIKERLSPQAHGDMPRWLAMLDNLPAGDPHASRDLLLELAPWRKGPFSLDGIEIDAEWRSDLKWDRLQPAIKPLDGRNVLDVGCGNGYYALRMIDAGAKCVIGIDPTVLYIVQFLAVAKFLAPSDIFVLPLRLSELPGDARAFDTTFSMGVLYHQRSPLEHLRELKATLRPGGQLVLETIFIPGEDSYACTPEDRYARMRNVWLLPTLKELTTWLDRSGFRDIEIVDTAVTTTAEQRTTEWMPFESLLDALDPDDASRTVEGWPAPRRVVAIANVP